MHPALGLAEELEGSHRALPHPGRQGRTLDDTDQLTDVAMVSGTMAVVRVLVVVVVLMLKGMGMAMRVVRDGVRDGDVRRLLDDAARKDDVDLERPESAAVDVADPNRHLGKAESGREPFEPGAGRASRHECAEEHVAADTRSGIDDGEAPV
jgi:hypothetical protein